MNNECPKCNRWTKRQNLGTRETLMGWTPRIDENGKSVNNNPNTYTTSYRCLECNTEYYIKERYGKVFEKKAYDK